MAERIGDCSNSGQSPKGLGARRPGASAAPAERQRAYKAREQARERTVAERVSAKTVFYTVYGKRF